VHVQYVVTLLLENLEVLTTLRVTFVGIFTPYVQF